MSDTTNSLHALRRRAFLLLKIALFLAVMWFVGRALYPAFHQIDPSKMHIRWGWFICAIFLLLFSTVAGSYLYSCLYKKLGESLSMSQAFTLLALPPLGKYLPGKVMALAGHAGIAKSFGIAFITSTTAILLVTGLGLVSIAILSLTLLLPRISHLTGGFAGLAAVGVILPVMIVALHPRIYWRTINSLLIAFKKPPIAASFNLRTTALLFLTILMQHGLFISGLSAVGFAVREMPMSVFPFLTGALSLSAMAGFVALFAPAGIGVREGVLLVILTPVLGAADAGVIAVFTRVAQTISDAVLGAAGLVTYARYKRIQSRQ
ncbi:MAG: lysylphosphatidylglycerol synthase domain-containing protein [Pseudomonadota bacterium]